MISIFLLYKGVTIIPIPSYMGVLELVTELTFLRGFRALLFWHSIVSLIVTSTYREKWGGFHPSVDALSTDWDEP